MDFSTINFLAVFVAAIAAFFIGFMWHGPVFGKQWMKLKHIPQSEVHAMRAKGMGPMVPNMIAAFVQQLVLAFVMASLASALSIADAWSAVTFAVLIWFGFIATTLFNSVLWEKETLSLYFFRLAYHLVSLIAVALIVVLWR